MGPVHLLHTIQERFDIHKKLCPTSDLAGLILNVTLLQNVILFQSPHAQLQAADVGTEQRVASMQLGSFILCYQAELILKYVTLFKTLASSRCSCNSSSCCDQA